MKLHVGIIQSSPGWQTLLQQEGIPFSFLSSPDQLRLSDFSVVVVNGRFSARWQEAIRKYVRQGGALLSTAENYLHYFGRDGRRRKIRYLVPDQNSPFAGVGLVDVYTQGTIIEGASFCPTNFGQPSIRVESIGDGLIIIFPLDPGEIIHDRRKRIKYFYSSGPRYPFEHVSLVSKSEVRKLVHAALELLHHKRGLPYCHLWYFPSGARNVFALRVDSDYGTEQEIEALYKFSEDHALKMSWFLHTQNHEQWLSNFARMNGHEMGLHCYEHAVLRSYLGSITDLTKGRDLLQQQDISPVGFAAPFGEWSPGLARALEEMGFSYSSEFSYDYDNLPSYPWMGERWNAVLQIPIHPICVGSFQKLNVSEVEMIDYFKYIVSWKREANEPLFFYHHPKDGHHSVLEFLITVAKESGIPQVRLCDFSVWWKERLAASYSVEFTGNALVLTDRPSSRVFVHVTREFQETILPFSPMIDFAKVDWREKQQPIALSPDIEKIRTFSLHLVLDEIRNAFRRKFK